MQVKNNTVVSVRYRMKNSKGEILEDIMESLPIAYLHGSGRILPALEEKLIGLKTGDERSFNLSQQEGFSEVDDCFSFEIIVDDVRPATEEELTVGQILEKYKDECGPNCTC